MRLEVDASVWPDFFMSAAWYELERRGLGADLFDEAAATIERIEINPYLFPCVHGTVRGRNFIGFLSACFLKLSTRL